jgi:hypothetical protein
MTSQAIEKVQRATKWRHKIAQGVSPGFKIDHNFSPEGPTYQAGCVAHYGAKNGSGVLTRAHALGYSMPPFRGSFYFFNRLSAKGTLTSAGITRPNKFTTSPRKWGKPPACLSYFASWNVLHKLETYAIHDANRRRKIHCYSTVRGHIVARAIFLSLVCLRIVRRFRVRRGRLPCWILLDRFATASTRLVGI